MSEVLSAQHILVEHEHEAQDLLKKLSEGESFEKLANALQVKMEAI